LKYRDVYGNVFDSNDPFTSFTYSILKNISPFIVNESAASISNHVAYSVNRFSAQHKFDCLLESGIQPLLEEIL